MIDIAKTFGDSAACQTFSKILNANGDKKLTAYFTFLFSEYGRVNKDLVYSSLDDKTYRLMRQLTFEHFRDRIKSNKTASGEIKDYALNVLKYRYRKFINSEY